MPLLAKNLTGSPVALAAGTPAPLLPAGATVNVTSELRGLSGPNYTALESQRPGTVEYSWTSSSEFPTGTLTVGVPGSAPRIDRYVSAQALDVSPPAGAKWARIVLVGGGGGGGGGRCGAAGTDRFGGGGGAGGGKTVIHAAVTSLPPVLSIVVGAGGAGGAGASADNSDGAAGTQGDFTIISDGATLLWAAGGGPGGLGGTALAGTGGNPSDYGWEGTQLVSGIGGNSGFAPPDLTNECACGGGGGGYIPASNIPQTGGPGGSSGKGPTGGDGGIQDSNPPLAGGPPSNSVVEMRGGSGGGGGAASITQAAQNGATGGCYGGGGGGGGASLNGFAAGAGAAGKNGAVEITWF